MARPFRFTFILLLAALGTGLSAVGGWRFARASAPVNGPIILISIDTLRADHLPAYGYTKVRTPAIDALAADGAVFERAYSHAPQTLPAHAAILSGRLPFETGVRDDIAFALKPGERLLPQMLGDRGFATGGVVSAYALRKETGIAQGFEFFDGEMPAGSPELPGGQVQRDGSESEAVAERWLDQQTSQRVFLFLHLYEPHAPYEPPAKYAHYGPYDGEIAYADEIVGTLVRYLKSHQMYDRSTIILLSDHGEGLGDHGEQEHGLFLYDETIRVPLIIKQAGGGGAGRRIADVVQQVDIAPTILDLAKAPIPGNLRGRSLTKVLEGTGRLQEQPVYSEARYARYRFGWSELTSVVDGRYRYIKAPKEELYDLERDPRERENVADNPARAETHEKLRGALARTMTGASVETRIDVSAEDRERLASVGDFDAGAGAPLDAAGGQAIDPKDELDVLAGYRRANRLIATDRPGAAIDLLQQLARDHASIADVWRQLAGAQLLAGRHEAAARAYERAAALNPAEPGALLAAASALYRAGRFDEAQHDAAMALEDVPAVRPGSIAAAEEILARISVARKDLEAARDHAERGQRAEASVRLVPYVDGLIAYEQQQYDEALSQFLAVQAGLKKGAASPGDLHYYTGETLARLDRWDEAIAEFQAQIGQSPRHLRARASLARVYVKAGRREEAERELAALIKVGRTPEGYALAARAWTLAGEPRRGEALKAEARRLFRGDPTLKLLARSK